jgi:hypothetical protein
LLGSSSENISAISNATSSTMDEKEKWGPTPCEKEPTPVEEKSMDPHTQWLRKAPAAQNDFTCQDFVLEPEAIFH